MRATHLMDFIGELFDDLPNSMKSECLAMLYVDMTAAQRDDFLERTGNA